MPAIENTPSKQIIKNINLKNKSNLRIFKYAIGEHDATTKDISKVANGNTFTINIVALKYAINSRIYFIPLTI